MKNKILFLLIITCFLPLVSIAQIFSTGSAYNNVINNQQSFSNYGTKDYGLAYLVNSAINSSSLINRDSLKLTEISKKFDGVSPYGISKAFNVGDNKGNNSECLIAHNTDLYHFTLNNPASEVSYNTSAECFLDCAEYINGNYYITSSNLRYLMKVDPESGAITIISSYHACSGIALNPINNMVYGISLGEHSKLYTVNLETGVDTYYADISENNHYILGMTINNNGRCFVIDATANGIDEVNLATGEIIKTLPAEFSVMYGQDMACDRETNTVYWAAYNVDAHLSQLYLVDFDNNRYIFKGQFSSQASCFAIMSTAPSQNIPAVPTDITAISGVGHTLNCDLSWTNPVVSIGGDTLSNISAVFIKRNGLIIHEFTYVAVGQSMTYSDNEVPESGQYTYSIYAVNDAGNGSPASVDVFVGCVNPNTLSVSDVTDASATLSWIDVDDADTWNIEYGPAGFTHGEGTFVTVHSTTATIADLNPATYYTAYVQAVCSDNNPSPWSDSVSFITAVVCPESSTPVEAQLGDGTKGTYKIPVNTFWKHSYVQELFTSEELSSQGLEVGMINTLSFQYFHNDPIDLPITVFLGNTNVTDLSAGWIINGLTQVYQGTVTFNNSNEDYWNDIQLQNVFTYSGGNLVVAIVYDNDSYYGPTSRFYMDDVSSQMTRHAYRDSAPINPNNPGISGAVLAQRNNMKFSACNISPEYITVTGTVTALYTQQPVSNAAITFDGAFGSTVTTDNNGDYTVVLIQGFNYYVTINAEGYNTYNETYKTPASEIATKDFVIFRHGLSINSDSIIVSAYSMQTVTENVVISNNSNENVTWKAKCIMDDVSIENTAYVAIGGTDIYTFDLDNPEGATFTGFTAPEFLNGMCNMNGMYYFTTATSGYFGTFDPESGAFTIIKTGNKSLSVAYNPVTDKLYGVSTYSTSITSKIYTISPNTGNELPVVNMNGSYFILGIEFTDDGQCFVINGTDNCISKVNLSNGGLTQIVAAGFNVNYGQDLDCVRATNTLYWAAYNVTDHSPQLYVIDVDNHTLIYKGTFPGQASGFAIITSNEIPWLTTTLESGLLLSGTSDTLSVALDGSHADEGVFTGHVELTDNKSNDTINIPVTFTIMQPNCNAPRSLSLEVENFNDILLSWNVPEEGMPVSYNVYYGGEHEPLAVVEDTHYIDDNLNPDDYCYEVRAVYENGCISLSSNEVCVTTESPYSTIEGLVTSSLTNNPISFAEITFDGETTYNGHLTFMTTTDANGQYMTTLYTGVYNVNIIADGYNAIIDTLTISKVPIMNKDFTMNQPLISVDPTTVDVSTNYMNDTSAEVVIINNGTGDLQWWNKVTMNDKNVNSQAYITLNSTDICTFPLDNPESATSTGFTAPEFLNSMCYMDGTLYFATATRGLFGTFDPATGAFTIIKSGNYSGSVAYNPKDGKLYGATLGVQTAIYTIDPTTGIESLVQVAANSNFVLGLEFNNEGRCFLIDAEIDGISEMNLSTGEFTTIVAAGFNVNYGQDLDCDRETNTIYWAAFNATSIGAQLYSLNLENNSLTLIGTFAKQASGFAIPTTESWLKSEPTAGVIQAGQSGVFTLLFKGDYADYGTFTGTCFVSNNTLTPNISIPVTFTINPTSCYPVQNTNIEVIDYNNIHLIWSAPADTSNLISYGIYHNDERIPFVIVGTEQTSFSDDSLVPGEYCYRIRAMYSDGCVSRSDTLLCTNATLQYGNVHGIVTDAYNGNPIKNAIIHFKDIIAITDNDGSYNLDVPVGLYKVLVSAPNYSSLLFPSVNVIIYENPQIDFQLVSLYKKVENLTGILNSDKDVVLTWDAPEPSQSVYYDIEQGFEGLTVGGKVVQQLGSPWTTWTDSPGGTEDAIVSDNYAYEGTKSMHLTFGNDIVCQLGNKTSGYYIMCTHLYIPSGKDGYFSILHSFRGLPNWAAEFYFNLNESGTVNANATTNYATFTYPNDVWFPVEVDMDLDNDTAFLTVNGIFVASWQFSQPSSPNGTPELKLAATDIYAATNVNQSEFYYDYLTFLDLSATKNPKNIASANLTGYEISRGDNVIAIVDAETLSFTDTDPGSDMVTYCVKAIYGDTVSSPVCTLVLVGLLGDANDDGDVNVLDIMTIGNYIIGYNPQPFNFNNADINHDGIINISDVQLLINTIMGKKVSNCKNAELTYTIENGIIYMHTTAPVSAFQISFDNADEIVPLAFENYSICGNKTIDGYVFVAYNLKGLYFDEGTYAIAKVNDATVNYFLASDLCGNLVNGKENSILGINNSAVTLKKPYPNPFATSVQVPYIINDVNANVDVSVTDVNGKVIYSEHLSNLTGIFEWKPAKKTSCVYFVNVIVNGIKVKSEKIVFQK